LGWRQASLPGDIINWGGPVTLPLAFKFCLSVCPVLPSLSEADQDEPERIGFCDL
jgi:hypothetical protein